MNRASAPGPDGFGPGFYQATWPDISAKVMRFLHCFQSGNVDMERTNRAHIVLLPKNDNAATADAYRPICLQNCSVKVASKITST